MPLPGMDCAVSTAPDHPALQVVKHRAHPCKLRSTYFIAGLSPALNFSTYNNSIDAAECAIKERVFFISEGNNFVGTPTPTPEQYNEGLKTFVAAFKKHTSFTTPMEPLAFAMAYQARKRSRYLKAVDSLQTSALTIKDSFVKVFLKFEKYLFKSGKKVVPRVISPRHDRFTVSLGRYVKPIEKKIYKIINQHVFQSPTILKGLNQEESGRVIEQKWNKFANPVFLGIDAKRFDQHVSVDALKFEHVIYRLFYPYDKHFASMLKMQLHNRCSVNMPDGFATYKLHGKRMSGDVTTGLGNCLICCAILYAFVQDAEFNIEIINNGDDSGLICEKEHLNYLLTNIGPYFLKYGFRMEVETPVYELEQVTFCQCSPVYDGTGYVMVRDPRISLTKDCVALKPLHIGNVAAMWMAAVGDCGLSLTGGIPVLQDFYNALKIASKGAKKLRDPTFDDWYHYVGMGLDRQYKEPTARSRYSFWLAFGIDPESQIAMEQYFNDIKIESTIDNLRCKYVDLPV